MQDPASIPGCQRDVDVPYLPLPNHVDLVITDVLPPAHLTPTAFVIGITSDGRIVLANHGSRGVEMTGGHINPGENAMQAARREGGEESGAEYGILWPIGYLRCESRGSVPEDHPYPHPVGYQAIYAAAVLSMDDRDDYLECNPPVVIEADEISTLSGRLSDRLPLLHAAAIAAIGRDRTIEELAQEARPLDDDDWGSSRQIDAENRFFDACRHLKLDVFAEGSEFSDWCLKATTDEMVDEALKLLAQP